MSIKNTLSATKAREEIFSLISKVQMPGQYFTLTENGFPKAVIISAEEFESWQETLEVMRDFPDLMANTKRAEREFKAGDYTTIEEILAKEGYVLNGKGNKKHEVSGRNPKKRTKGSR